MLTMYSPWPLRLMLQLHVASRFGATCVAGSLSDVYDQSLLPAQLVEYSPWERGPVEIIRQQSLQQLSGHNPSLSSTLTLRVSQRGVPLCKFLLHAARTPGNAFSDAAHNRRLQDELEQIQKRGRLSRLLAQGIEKSPVIGSDPRRSSGPFLIDSRFPIRS